METYYKYCVGTLMNYTESKKYWQLVERLSWRSRRILMESCLMLLDGAVDQAVLFKHKLFIGEERHKAQYVCEIKIMLCKLLLVRTDCAKPIYPSVVQLLKC